MSSDYVESIPVGDYWRPLALEIGGRFIDDRCAIQMRLERWIATLEAYGTSTYLRSLFLNPDGFRFTLYRRSFLSDVARPFGLQDLEVGDAELDREFVVQGNQPARVCAMLRDPAIRELVRAQPVIHLEITRRPGWAWVRLPAHVDALRFTAASVLITDRAQLRSLFALHHAVLRWLWSTDTCAVDEAARMRETLLYADGPVRSGRLLLWDGPAHRTAAVRRLGELRDRSAVPLLLPVLEEPDLERRAAAVRALGEIGAREAVPRLVPLLGDWTQVENVRLAMLADGALRKLGEAERVDLFDRAVRGQEAPLEPLAGCPEYRQAFLGILQGPGWAAARAARALARLNAIEALPHIRARLRGLRFAEPEVRQTLDSAIRTLEQQSSLPRPAAAPDPDAASLPRPAGAPSPDAGELPIPASRRPEA